MGCEQTKQPNNSNDIIDLQNISQCSSSSARGTKQRVNISYRELIHQDRDKITKLYTYINIISKSESRIIRRVLNNTTGQLNLCKVHPLSKSSYLSNLRQVQFLKKLDHPNIVHLLEYFVEPAYLSMILEEIPGVVLSKSKTPQLLYILEIAKQILLALQYCHLMGVSHSDVTQNNIMIVWLDGAPVAKLIGFSKAVAVDVHNTNYENISSIKKDINLCGALIYSMIGGKVKGVIHILDDVRNVVQKLQISKDKKQRIFQVINLMLTNDNSKIPEITTLVRMLDGLILEIGGNRPHQQKMKLVLQRLLKFNPRSQLQYFILSYVSKNFSQTSDRLQYLQEFYLLDRDNTGTISFQQMCFALKKYLSLSDSGSIKSANSLWKKFSKQKQQQLCYSEFVLATMDIYKYMNDEFLKKVFDQMDSDKDNIIKEQDINNLLGGIGIDEVTGEFDDIGFQQFKNIIL